MADVELLHALDRRHRFHVLIGEPVAGVDPQAQVAGDEAAFGESRQFQGLGLGAGLGVGAGVQFHPAGAAALGGLQLAPLRIHEQAHRDAGVLEAPH